MAAWTSTPITVSVETSDSPMDVAALLELQIQLIVLNERYIVFGGSRSLWSR